jgi:uncharacterized membrane protein YhhN
MLIPVVVYSLVLSGMRISAMLADLGMPLAGFGAILFIASDAMIAISKFRHPFRTASSSSGSPTTRRNFSSCGPSSAALAAINRCHRLRVKLA